jgi:HEAT repeat protein
MNAFAAAVLGLGIVNSALLVVLALRRVKLAAETRRHERTAARLRPLVLAFVDGDAELPDELTEYEREVVADVLGGYGRLVRGPSRARITAYFEEHGLVEHELAALAHHRAAWRRAAAAYRLGDIGSEAAAAGLIAALDDESRDVRTAAARSLGKLAAPDAVGPLLTAYVRDSVPTAVVGWVLIQIGAPALPRLRHALDADEPAHRAAATMMVGLIGDAGDGARVEHGLRDTSFEVRAEAARALGRLGGARSVHELVMALDDRVPAVRAAAATSLGRLNAHALDPLLEIAQEDHFDVARAAAQAAVAIDPDAAAAAARQSASPMHLLEAVERTRL